MAENKSDAEESVKDDVVDDDTKIEDDLKAVKENSEVESSQESDESEETEAKEESENEESEETEKTESAEETSFVKEFPNIKGDTPEEYAKNLEEAYKNSTAEALRLKSLAESPAEDGEITDPRLLYVDRIVQEDIAKTYDSFRKDYPQVDDPANYEKFTQEVADLSSYHLEKKGFALTAKELYPRAAANLGWEKQVVDDKDKLGNALKDRASTSKTSSKTKSTPKSNVSDAEVTLARQTWATSDMSDAKIKEELAKVKT